VEKPEEVCDGIVDGHSLCRRDSHLFFDDLDPDVGV
jgi:hypothetical protein